MVKLKDIATIQTGVYLKSAPSPDTCYLQVNDFDEEGNIRPTVRPTTTVSSKAARHLLTESDLLLAAKGGKNLCAIAPTQLEPCVASPSFLIILSSRFPTTCNSKVSFQHHAFCFLKIKH